MFDSKPTICHSSSAVGDLYLACCRYEGNCRRTVEPTGSAPLFSIEVSGVRHDSMLRDIGGFVESDEAGVSGGEKHCSPDSLFLFGYAREARASVRVITQAGALNMQKSESNTAEQCLVSPGKKKWSVVKVFWSCFKAVRFFVNMFALIDKYGSKALAFFKELLE